MVVGTGPSVCDKIFPWHWPDAWQKTRRVPWLSRVVTRRALGLPFMGQVSEPLGQRTHDPKGSARASRSLVKGLSWKDVESFTKEWVVSELPSAKRMEADGLGAEIDLAPDQPVGPEGIRLEGEPQEAHRAGRRGTPNENHDAVGLSLQIRLPRGRERTPLGSAGDAGGGPLTVGADIAPGALLEVGERVMEEARPDFSLPAAVEVFDGGLEAAFLRRGETGTTSRRKHVRTTRPTESRPWWPPWKMVSLSNCA